MTLSIHHIQRQKLLLKFHDEDLAKRWTRQGGDFYREKILVRLEGICDQLFTDDSLTVVNRIEVDIGTVSESELAGSEG
jgi:hypothetical protein